MEGKGRMILTLSIQSFSFIFQFLLELSFRGSLVIGNATDHPFVCGQNKTFYLSLKREKISFTIDLVEI